MEVQVKLIPSGVDEDGEDQFLELDEAIISTLKPILREYAAKHVEKMTTDVLKATVTEHVAALSKEAFAEAFQATDHWGKAKGEPKTLAQIVSEMTAKYLGENIDSNGRQSYSGKPRCEQMIFNAIGKALKGELDKQLSTLRAEFAEKIAAKLAKVKVS